MKKLVFAVCLLSAISMAKTKRVHVTCSFEAVAAGYEDWTATRNAILKEGKHLYNIEGELESSDVLKREWFTFYSGYTLELTSFGEFIIYDTVGKLYTGSSSTGNATCVIENGWIYQQAGE